MRLLVVLAFLFSAYSFAGEQSSDIVGCWDAEIEDYHNVVTVCVNHDFGSISTLFSNDDVGVPPTRCTQPATVALDSSEEITLKGLGGLCRNGNRQGDVTMKCNPAGRAEMQCKIFTSYHEVKATKREADK